MESRCRGRGMLPPPSLQSCRKRSPHLVGLVDQQRYFSEVSSIWNPGRMAGGGAVARSARDGITDHTTRLRPREQRSPEGRTYAVRRDAAHRRSRARGRGAWLGWGWPGVDLFRTQFLWSAMASSEKIAMKARMVMAVQPIRKTHVGGRSRRKASFRRRKLSVSADLHRGCTRGVYDFAVGRSNHLYSVAVVTNSVGAVVERYSYNAYGVRTIKDAANVLLLKSAVGGERGFTGYRFDGETGNYYARARMYSANLGDFISRDPWRKVDDIQSAGDGYHDGYSLYGAYFAVNALDPEGTYRSVLCVTNTFKDCIDRLKKLGKPINAYNMKKCGEEVEKKCPDAQNWFELPPMVFCGKHACVIYKEAALIKCNSITGLNERTACLRAVVAVEKVCNTILIGGAGVAFPGASEPYDNEVVP